MDFKIEGTFSDDAKGLEKGPTTQEKLQLVDAIEKGIIAGGNYRKVMSGLQGSWKPLNKRYLAKKLSKGYSRKKWFLSGTTKHALTTPIFASRGERSVKGRTLKVKTLHKNRFMVRFEWQMRPPSASGWPGKQKARTWFAKNNRARRLFNIQYMEFDNKALDGMMDVVFRFFTRAGKM